VGSEHTWPALHQQLGVVESKNMLHHLAHMAMHVDIDDCQIYAGAQCLLGRAISRHEYLSAETRMKAWGRTPEARKATFHALQLLLSVLFCGSKHLRVQTKREQNEQRWNWVCFLSDPYTIT
jgi:hypothetical protein